jgi:quinol monooxygenase YgiN
VVLEYIRYVIPDADAQRFEDAYRVAGQVLDNDTHCVGYEVARGVEEPEHFVVRIEWDSVEGHEQGFRASPGFPAFFAAVKPFVSEIKEMKHYEVRNHAAQV